MNKCISCNSERIISLTGKTSDCFGFTYKDKEYDGYVPDNIGIGSSDYIEFSYCLNCGKIQFEFPIKEEIINELLNKDIENDN